MPRQTIRKHICVVGNADDVGGFHQSHETLYLVSSNDIESQEHVLDVGVSHHLSLAKFLHSYALGTHGQLQLCDGNELVDFDVRPVGDADTVTMRLPACKISDHDIEVDKRHRCFKILDTPGQGLEFKETLWHDL